jgi:putative redox protein
MSAITKETAKSRISEVTVSGSAKGFAQDITNGRNHLAADEPISAGGTDTGLDPHELLIAALGACTSMTISMYARHKEWPLESVSVSLRHAKVAEADGSQVERIERDITLHGSLSEEQRTRLLDIANKCPVHRTLTSKLNIDTQLV